jgi:hypothetical protein
VDTLTTFNASIVSNDDDGVGFGGIFGSGWDELTSGQLIQAGVFGAFGYNVAGFRFIGISIPQAAYIISATITLNQRLAAGTIDSGEWHAWAIDDAPVYDNTDNPTVVPLTTASAPYIFDSNPVLHLVDHDVTDIVQEIIDRGGWVSGNAINFTCFPGSSLEGTNYDEIDDFSSTDTIVAAIEIEYSTSPIYDDTIDDEVEAEDDATAVATFNASLSDTVAGSESMAAAATFNATTSESVTATDAMVPGNVISVSISDSVSATDALVGGKLYVDTTSDSAAATEAFDSGLIIPASISDSVLGSDILFESVIFQTAFTDSVAGSDLFTTTQVFVNSTSDSVTASDSEAAATTFSASTSDPATATDSLSAAARFSVSISDTVAGSDALAATITFDFDTIESVAALFTVSATAIYLHADIFLYGYIQDTITVTGDIDE